ncbi:MAG: tripartite tricarboxylate transporter substrate binding protein [Alphaproteobacteria bacterium]|nr:tripartite tricarboxylate transporter substrate binding protein [Alphaproteobacteria bacterium]
MADEAAEWPKKPITVIVGFGAGGGTDTYARILASVIPALINNQPLIIVNKTGGAQVPAMKFTAKSKPDGYTMQFFSTGSGVLATMLRDRGVDWFRDFRPISQIGNLNMLLMSPKSKGFKTPKDLAKAIRAAYAKGKKLRWGHPGRGAVTNVSGVAWLIENDLIDKVQDIPFKGGAPTKAALLGGQVDFGVLGVQHLTGLHDRMNGLAIFANERDPIRKEVPSMKEMGMPFVPFNSPMIMAVPAKTPQYVIDRMDAAIKKATETRAFKKLTKKTGLVVRYQSSKPTLAMMLELRKQWTPTIEFIKKRRIKK